MVPNLFTKYVCSFFIYELYIFAGLFLFGPFLKPLTFILTLLIFKIYNTIGLLHFHKSHKLFVLYVSKYKSIPFFNSSLFSIILSNLNIYV